VKKPPTLVSVEDLRCEIYGIATCSQSIQESQETQSSLQTLMYSKTSRAASRVLLTEYSLNKPLQQMSLPSPNCMFEWRVGWGLSGQPTHPDSRNSAQNEQSGTSSYAVPLARELHRASTSSHIISGISVIKSSKPHETNTLSSFGYKTLG
jgi:hypothetical protein